MRDQPDLADPDISGLLLQVLAYVLVILVFGAACIFVIKKVLPRISRPAGKRIAVLETAYLGPHKTLHLLRVGRREFLVAGSREHVSMLAEVTDACDDDQSGDSSGDDC